MEKIVNYIDAANIINDLNIGKLVSFVNGEAVKEDYITGIRTYRRNEKDIGFTRLCADSIVAENFIEKITFCISDNSDELSEIRFYHKGGFYSYQGGTGKAIDHACRLPDKFALDDLMTAKYLNTDLITRETVNGKEHIFIPVSHEKIGKMTLRQETNMKRLLGLLGGDQAKMQFARLPAFSIVQEDGRTEIYGWIYNIGTGSFHNSTLIYNSAEDFTNLNPFKSFLEIAA